MFYKYEAVVLWIENANLSPSEIDCVTAIMLKILDGKCKMFPHEKEVMTVIYDVTKHKEGKILGNDLHRLINRARHSMSKELVEQIYEQRLFAETMISRPVMKAFKAMLRENNIFGNA